MTVLTREELAARLATIPKNLSRLNTDQVRAIYQELAIGKGWGTSKQTLIMGINSIRGMWQRNLEWHDECDALVAVVAAELSVDVTKLTAWAHKKGLMPLREMQAKAKAVAAFVAEVR